MPVSDIWLDTRYPPIKCKESAHSNGQLAKPAMTNAMRWVASPGCILAIQACMTLCEASGDVHSNTPSQQEMLNKLLEAEDVRQKMKMFVAMSTKEQTPRV